MSCLTIDDEKCIVDAVDGPAVAVSDVVVEDIAKALGARDRYSVPILFRESCCFSAGKDGIATSVSDLYIVLGKSCQVFKYFVDVPEANTLLKELSGDQLDVWFS